MDSNINPEQIRKRNKPVIVKEIREISNRNSAALLALFVVSDLLLALFALILPHVGKELSDETYNFVYKVGYYAIYYLIGLPLAIYVANRGTRSFKSFFTPSEKSTGFVVKWFVIGYAVTVFVNFICVILSYIIQKVGNFEFNTPAVSASTETADIIFSAVVMLGCAPFFEEIMFRGAILKNTEKYGTWMSIIVSAVMFGAFHRNYAQFFYTMVTGIFLGFVAHKTKSIIPTMKMHFFINGISFTLLMLANSFNVDLSRFIKNNASVDGLSVSDIEGDIHEMFMEMLPVIAFTVIIGLLVIVGFILFVVEVLKARDEKKPECENPEAELAKHEKFFAYISAPVTIMGIIYSSVYIVAKMLGAI